MVVCTHVFTFIPPEIKPRCSKESFLEAQTLKDKKNEKLAALEKIEREAEQINA